MVVIAALLGTFVLGQEVFITLSRDDSGPG
ncbi:ABC-type proline/glycine betaine transport system permease subunit [Roseovarius sp. MBR-51]